MTEIPPYPARCEAREADLAGEETFCVLAAGHAANHCDGILEWADDGRPLILRRLRWGVWEFAVARR